MLIFIRQLIGAFLEIQHAEGAFGIPAVAVDPLHHKRRHAVLRALMETPQGPVADDPGGLRPYPALKTVIMIGMRLYGDPFPIFLDPCPVRIGVGGGVDSHP